MGFSTAQLLIVPNIDTDTETRQQYQWINNLCTQDLEHHSISIQHSAAVSRCAHLDGVGRCIAPLPSSGAGGGVSNKQARLHTTHILFQGQSIMEVKFMFPKTAIYISYQVCPG